MVREKILHQTRAGIIGGETAARQRCRTARTYILAQTLRCPSYAPAPPSLLSLILGMQARHCWNELLTDWNGVSFFERPGWEPAPDIHILSDASGKLGYGVFHHNEWINGRWLPAQEHMCIAYKELFPIVLACALWGSKWQQKRVHFRCDNETDWHI